MAEQILNEGVPVRIEWHLLTPGSTFFVPTLQTLQIIRSVCRAAKKRRVVLVYKICIHDGFFGVRFWRPR